MKHLRSSIVAASVAASLLLIASTSFGTSKMSSAEEGAARSEIENLLATTVFAYDNRDADAFADSFMPEGEVQTVPSALHPEGGEAFKGRERVKYFAVKNFGGGANPGAGGPPGAAPGGAAPGAAPAGSPPAGFPGGAAPAGAGATPPAGFAGGPPGGAAPAGGAGGPAAGGGAFSTHHIVTSSYVHFIDNTHATHFGYWSMAGGTMGNYRIIAMGNYEDHLEKYKGKWLFKSRKMFYGPLKVTE